ncbi:MAG: BatA and WFA domain-containing protein [Candidatus Binatia bacterium]|nr:BatA and WFA domain-containing protein [Candidatus Binatia bacterium]
MGFENPAWLLGVGLIAPLVWLYLRVRPKPPAMVSSLRIWRHVPSPAAPPRRRPKLPPVFFLQALLIVVSSVALASPYRKEPRPPGPPRDAVLVADVSASMQSRHEGSTRFEAAIDSAQARAVELSGEGRRITVVRAGPQPEALGSGLDGAAARAKLEELEPLDTSANLTAAIELAATLAGPDGSIDVFSDTAASGIVMSRDARAIADIHTFGASGENVAVTDVRVQTNPFDEESAARLLVTVRNYSTAAREVGLEILPLGDIEKPVADETDATDAEKAAGSDEAEAPADGGEAAETEIGPQLVHTLTLEPRGQEIVSVDGVRWAGAFEARLSADDDLALDDVVFGYIPRGRSVDILLVSDDTKLATRLVWLAERAGSFAVRTTTPQNYDPQDVGEITVFDRFVPELPPPSNVAYLAPSSGNADVTVVEQTGATKVAERREHSLLRGVTTTEGLLGKKPVGLAPGALRPVLLGRSDGREIALIQAGEIGGRQIVTTAFRIDPAKLTRADDLPSLIFTLNLLSFLSPESIEAPLLRTTGERLRAGSRLAAPIEKVEGPDGSHRLGAGADLTLERAGVYEASSRTGTRPMYVSFIDATESDIHREPDATAADEPTTDSPTKTTAADGDEANWTEIPYLREVLLVVALLLLAEWLFVAAVAPGRARSAGTKA